MIYRNMKTGAVINTPCKISGKDWQEATPAGFPLKKQEVAPVQQEEPEKAEAEAPKEEAKEEAKEEKKPSKGATIRPKKGK